MYGNSAMCPRNLEPNTTYVYQVRAADPESNEGPTTTDLATTIIFTDDPVVAGVTTIKAVHLTQLRTGVNAVRVAAGLASVMFTNPIALGTTISAADVNELRTNLDPARSIIGVPPIPYTDPGLMAGDIIKAAHVQELRSGVK